MSTGRFTTRSLMQGNLAETPLADLLGFLQRMRKTGQLMIERARPRQAAGVFVRDGQPYHALCPPEVGERAIHALLSWPEGRFAFVPEAQGDETSITSDLQAILLDGMRRLDELERWCQDLPPRITVMYRVLDSERTGAVRLTLAEWRLVQLVDGARTIADLIALSYDSPAETASELHALIAAGLITDRPDYGFLDTVVLRSGAPGGSARAAMLSRHLIDRSDGRETLRETVEHIPAPIQQVLDEVVLLLRAGVLRVLAGEDAVRRHLL